MPAIIHHPSCLHALVSLVSLVCFALTPPHTPTQEVLGLLCQVAQLASTYLIITTATNKYRPLEDPWFAVVPGAVPVLQAFATSIAAVGSGVLLAGVLTGHVDGAGMS